MVSASGGCTLAQVGRELMWGTSTYCDDRLKVRETWCSRSSSDVVFWVVAGVVAANKAWVLTIKIMAGRNIALPHR